jgi:hypothetical protein
VAKVTAKLQHLLIIALLPSVKQGASHRRMVSILWKIKRLIILSAPNLRLYQLLENKILKGFSFITYSTLLIVLRACARLLGAMISLQEINSQRPRMLCFIDRYAQANTRPNIYQ